MSNSLLAPASNKHIDEIVWALRENRVLVVLGAGAVLQSTQWPTKPDPRLWDGLIEHGLFFLRSELQVNVSSLEARLKRIRIELASQPISDSTTTKLAQIAYKLRMELDRHDAFGKWLAASVGSLRPTKPCPFLDALRHLGTPLLTTNYDEVLERYYFIDATTWLDGFEVERFAKATSHAIFHLHGFWKWPRSVIFSHKDYMRITRDQAAQEVIHALRYRYNFLYIGCGAGAADPNIGAFRRWAAKHFKASGYTDWMLIQGDQPPVQRLKRERLTFVPYSDHAKLPAILEEISAAAWRNPPLPIYSLSTSAVFDDNDKRKRVISFLESLNADYDLPTAAQDFLYLQEDMIRAGLGPMRIDLGTRLRNHVSFNALPTDLQLNVWLSLAQAFQDQHLPECVIEAVMHALVLVSKARPEDIRLQTLFALLQTRAAGLTEAGSFEEAIRHANHAVNEINPLIPDNSQQARNRALALQVISVAAKRASHTDAEARLSEALTASIAASDHELIVAARINLAEFKAATDVDVALKQAEEAVRAARDGAYRVSLAEALQTKAEVLTTAKQPEEAMLCAKEALSIGRQSRHEKIIAQSLAAIGRAHILSKAYAEAIETIQSSRPSGSPEVKVYLAFLQWVAALLDGAALADQYKEDTLVACDQAEQRKFSSTLARDVAAIARGNVGKTADGAGTVQAELSDHRIVSILEHLNCEKS